MKKLELKDICGYLPYGLLGDYMDRNRPTLLTLGVGYFQGKTYLTFDEEIVPILRPLSDLYETITHNGNETVPIVECARIAFENLEWSLGDSQNATAINPKGDELNFRFSQLYCGFGCGYGIYYSVTIYNQVQLFDYLDELKIDYRGLIEAGLAVSVYDLENNPYK